MSRAIQHALELVIGRAVLGLAATLVACGAPRADDPVRLLRGDASAFSSVDGGVARDALIDDAARRDELDSGRAIAIDAGSTCEPCASTTRCATAGCVEGECVVSPVPDGTGCDEVSGEGVCVDGLCVERGCGDGYREPGPMPMREECDDGRAGGDDACDDHCGARPSLVAEALGDPRVSRWAMATNSTGELLVAWTEDPGGGRRVMCRRYSRRGVPLDSAPRAIVEEHVAAAAPVVVGLVDGWVIGVESLARAGGEVRYVAVSGAGAVAPARSIAAGPVRQTSLRVASSGDRWLAVWLEDAAKLGARVLRMRAFEGELPVTDTVRAVGPAEIGDVALAAGEMGALVAWSARESGIRAQLVDWEGDLVGPAESVAAEGTEPALLDPLVPSALAYTSALDDTRGDVRVRLRGGEDVYVAASAAAETLAVGAPLGTGTLIAYQVGTPLTGRPRDVALVQVDARGLPQALSAEAARLLVVLADPSGVQSSATLARSRDVVWIAWLDSSGSLDGAQSLRLASVAPR